MESSTIKTLYNLLGINQKIKEEPLRFLYLKEVWGLEQVDIGKIEGMSQSYVSKVLIQARKTYPAIVVEDVHDLQFTAQELKYIQFLPREIIEDVVVIAFINDILGIEVKHPFFLYFDHTVQMRAAALASLGVQSKYLQKIYNKSQPAISMIIKRKTTIALSLERNNRYDNQSSFTLSPKARKNKFIIAGGK